MGNLNISQACFPPLATEGSLEEAPPLFSLTVVSCPISHLLCLSSPHGPSSLTFKQKVLSGALQSTKDYSEYKLMHFHLDSDNTRGLSRALLCLLDL